VKQREKDTQADRRSGEEKEVVERVSVNRADDGKENWREALKVLQVAFSERFPRCSWSTTTHEMQRDAAFVVEEVFFCFAGDCRPVCAKWKKKLRRNQGKTQREDKHAIM